MKIRLASDIHTEFHPPLLTIDTYLPPLPEDSETTLVLAGDVSVGIPSLSFLDEVSARFKHVVYVTGNHEYYNHDVNSLDTCIEDTIYDNWRNVHYLNNTSMVLDDVMFYGGTSWTHVEEDDQWTVQRSMSDFMRICKVDPVTAKVTKFTPTDANEIHEDFDTELRELLVGFKPPLPVVVVSHHTPSEQSADDMYKGDKLNCAYHNNYEELLKANSNVILWLHGHVHNSNDYIIGDTRVVSNPYGYHDYETNDDYNPELVLEV
jgi:Icc-related predicted phosphoesterase